MGLGFTVSASPKKGITLPESYVVSRGSVLYLRIVGSDPNYQFWTPTAADDGHEFQLPERVRLMHAALKFGAELNTEPRRKTDWAGREFIFICTFKNKPGSDAEDLAQFNTMIAKFFDIFDSCDPTGPKQMDGMREIYEWMAPDDSGEDLYLSDGVWLSADGSLQDKGR